jgi:hypothetical protein
MTLAMLFLAYGYSAATAMMNPLQQLNVCVWGGGAVVMFREGSWLCLSRGSIHVLVNPTRIGSARPRRHTLCVERV